MDMREIRDLWDRGPFTKVMLVLLVAGPLTVGLALIAPVLLMAGVIGPTSYGSFRSVIYWGIGFLVLASLAFAASRFNGET